MPEGPLTAVDSIAYRRSHQPAPGVNVSFKGLMAASIFLSDPEAFAIQYEETLDAVFEEALLERLKKVYKAYEISRQLAGRTRAADAVFHRFARRLFSMEGLRINVYLGHFDVVRLAADLGVSTSGDPTRDFEELPLVGAYGRSPGRKYVSVHELISLIEHPFPALAAWKLTDVARVRRQTFLLDEIGGCVSKAWEELVESNLVQTVPHGDSCSPFISAVDLLLRAIDRQLGRSHSRLVRTDVEAAIHSIAGGAPHAETHVHLIGNQDIPMIVPHSEVPIPSAQFVRHPLFVVVCENTHKDERLELESSPLFYSIQDRAYAERGSIAFYNPRVTPGQLRPGDWIVTYGPVGEATYSRLKSMSHSVNQWRAGANA